jgi:hypothetical protein
MKTAKCNKSPTRDGFIYFVQSGSYVKIGFAANPQARLATLRSHARHRSLEDNRPWDHKYAVDFELLGTVIAKAYEERDAHERFIAYRIGKTEWFRYEGELIRAASRLATINAERKMVVA